MASLYYPLFVTLSKTGMRLGEAVALRWDGVDLVARQITVKRTFSMGNLGTRRAGRRGAWT